MRQLDIGMYEVSSDSNPFKTYVVTLASVNVAGDYAQCTCPAWAIARNRAASKGEPPPGCKHVKRILAEVKDVNVNAPFVPAPVVEAITLTTGMAELRPMLATEIASEKMVTYVNNDNWYAEQKVDGHRVLIHIQNGSLMVLGRGGQASQHAGRFSQPHYKDIIRLRDSVIDGELIGDIFWIFDLPHCDSEGITIDSPYIDRRQALEKLFEEWKPNDAYRLLPAAKTCHHGVLGNIFLSY